jgi:hypothetical protein
LTELPFIESTNEPNYFGFYSLELKGFSGGGDSIAECFYKAKRGMKEYVGLLTDGTTGAARR